MNRAMTNLHDLIMKLIILLEDELDLLAGNKNTSAIKVKRNITDCLGRLVNIVIQLNKSGDDELANDKKSTLNNSDKEIIERFIGKYNSSKDN